MRNFLYMYNIIITTKKLAIVFCNGDMDFNIIISVNTIHNKNKKK